VVDTLSMAQAHFSCAYPAVMPFFINT